jgi:23S rRNA pseudouridine1911/1915/1917 synthase
MRKWRRSNLIFLVVGAFKVGEYTVNSSVVMNSEKQISNVPEELAGMRLDQALARMFPEYSRSRLKDWLLAGAITVDGGAKRPRDAVSGGEAIELIPQAETEVHAEPEPIQLDVVYEDEHLLVVNKPAVPRAGIIHRIDKDTSGLLLIGKTIPAHTALVRQLADRDVSRNYLAICNGVLTGGGKIDQPIGRHPVDRKRMSVQQSGKPAVTHYTVLERFRAFTYISVKLETGRTHQVRVHFAWRRHALVGDPVYGGRLALPAGASDSLVEILRRFKRQALHATRLAFVHPATGERVDLQVPPPPDFEELLAALRADAAGAGQ